MYPGRRSSCSVIGLWHGAGFEGELSASVYIYFFSRKNTLFILFHCVCLIIVTVFSSFTRPYEDAEDESFIAIKQPTL